MNKTRVWNVRMFCQMVSNKILHQILVICNCSVNLLWSAIKQMNKQIKENAANSTFKQSGSGSLLVCKYLLHLNNSNEYSFNYQNGNIFLFLLFLSTYSLDFISTYYSKLITNCISIKCFVTKMTIKRKKYHVMIKSNLITLISKTVGSSPKREWMVHH